MSKQLVIIPIHGMLAALLPLAQPSLRTLTEVEVLINRENLTLKTEQKNAGINHSRLLK
jgi:hypothetical protein